MDAAAAVPAAENLVAWIPRLRDGESWWCGLGLGPGLQPLVHRAEIATEGKNEMV